VVNVPGAGQRSESAGSGKDGESMSRVHVGLPEKFNFSMDVAVRRSDISAGNHLGAIAILPYTSEVMEAFLRRIGLLLSNQDRTGMVMADATLVFKSQAFYGETLKIEMAVTDFTKKAAAFITC